MKAEIQIKGVSPLLMHKFPMVETPGIEKKPAADQAEISAYRDQTGGLYIPGQNIQRALVSAAAYSKGKGRASLIKKAAATLILTPEILSLGIQNYAIDSRSVVIAATGGRIIRHRPRIDPPWSVSFILEWDEAILGEKEVRKIVDDCGSLVGLLDFRPACKGPYGRFMVSKWDTE